MREDFALRAVRADLALRGVKMGEFAKIVGVSPSYLSSALNGRIRISKELAVRIRRALNALGEPD